MLALASVAVVVSAAVAETAVEAATKLIAGFHHDLARLDRAREILDGALRAEPRSDTMVMLSQVHLLQGDFTARTRDEKLAAYERGREVAKQAIALAPRDDAAHLWYVSNIRRWGQTVGVMQALGLLRTMREDLELVVSLNPRSARGHMGIGSFLFELPELTGAAGRTVGA